MNIEKRSLEMISMQLEVNYDDPRWNEPCVAWKWTRYKSIPVAWLPVRGSGMAVVEFKLIHWGRWTPRTFNIATKMQGLRYPDRAEIETFFDHRSATDHWGIKAFVGATPLPSGKFPALYSINGEKRYYDYEWEEWCDAPCLAVVVS